MADCIKQEADKAIVSIVRSNLLSRPGYTPYCGDFSCSWDMPRTQFNGQQFACRCGWTSKFEPEFIAQYKAKWVDAR